MGENAFRRKFRYLLSLPIFWKHPARLLVRAFLWLFYCVIGHSPRFRISRGLWFKVDPVLHYSGSSSAFILREWAEPELTHLDELLTPGDNFIDCGANIGIYTVCAAGIVGPSGRVIAVEPSKVSFRRLERNVAMNKLAQVALVNEAVSETQGRAHLYHADHGPVSFSLVPKPETEFEEVSTTTIDALAEQSRLDHVECIKLDVEGVEAAVVRGARGVLSRFKPVVIFERTSYGQRRQASSENVANTILSFGYRIYECVETSPSATGYESPNLVGIHPESYKRVPAFLKPWAASDA